MKWFNLLLRLVLGGLFVYAGVIKILDPAGFAKSISHFQILPHAQINLLAITLPWIEVLAGGLLIGGVWRRPSVLLIAGMLIVFIVAIGYAMHRGLNIECGCFGTKAGPKVGWTKIGENTAMLLGALWLFWREKD
jgi:uncharacterized membrane protein YphA (DoxX/SURF4 family)